jgi:hypothetical protein
MWSKILHVPHHAILSSFISQSPSWSNILPSTLFVYTPGLCSTLNVRDQVSYTYDTTGKFIVLYTLTFMFLDGVWEDKT